jgi:DNA-binding NarL/FixJ family response regulator
MIRVLIADDHQLVRQGVTALLMTAKDIQIIGEARDGQEAIDLTERLQPDVVLMDIEMPYMDGLRATQQITAKGLSARVLILSMRMDEKDVQEAARRGAQGYLIKNSSREELIGAIRSVYEGKPACSPVVASFFK